MDILFLLIPLSVVLILAAVAIFLWMFDNEQFDDLDGQAYKILTDDDTSEPSALDA
ncbi:MAG: cbb3-type cytochrome oxidase assembly protein CcoS [Burkholderiales bacterium]